MYGLSVVGNGYQLLLSNLQYSQLYCSTKCYVLAAPAVLCLACMKPVLKNVLSLACRKFGRLRQALLYFVLIHCLIEITFFL